LAFSPEPLGTMRRSSLMFPRQAALDFFLQKEGGQRYV
jgi:hypothetical protein